LVYKAGDGCGGSADPLLCCGREDPDAPVAAGPASGDGMGNALELCCCCCAPEAEVVAWDEAV